MPVKDPSRYPKDWPDIRHRIVERAGNRCECEGECGLHRTTPGLRRCEERGGEPARWHRAGYVVVLTVAHVLNEDPADCRDENLKALCPRCHNRLDASMRARHRDETRAAAVGLRQRPLFEPGGDT